MGTELATVPSSLEPVDWSLQGLLAVVLPKSRSASYPAALALAQSADRYVEQTAGRQTFHLAGFGRTPQQAARALELLRLARRMSGFQLFTCGALYADAWRAQKVLECYLQACGCSDSRAHCHIVVDAHRLELPGGGVRDTLPSAVVMHINRAPPAPHLTWAAQPERETFPCRFLLAHGFHYQPGHPASRADQAQAGAVREGCSWCPNMPRPT